MISRSNMGQHLNDLTVRIDLHAPFLHLFRTAIGLPQNQRIICPIESVLSHEDE